MSGEKQMTVRDLKPGKSAEITLVGGEGALRQHFLDMGVIPGAKITVTQLAPMGDPMEIRIHGDYYLPDFELPESPAKPIGRYGRMRRAYLEKHHPGLYERLILSGKLQQY